jgi:hypothetical protein
MSSFKRKLARQAAAETKTEQPHEHGHAIATPVQQKVTPRAAAKSLDRGRVLRRKSAGR